MNLFLDTSSLLKIYHREQDTDEILQLISQDVENIYLSELAKIEFNSAIFKKVRKKEFTIEKALEMIAFFEKDYANFQWIAIDNTIIEYSTELIKKHGTNGLRTLDSIQLSCAILKKSEINYFKTSDTVLKEIFIKENLQIC